MPTEVGFFGDDVIEIVLPEGTEVVHAPDPHPPLADLGLSVRRALANPVGSRPLVKLARPGARVVIAFDDLALPVPPMEEPDVRSVAIAIIVDILLGAGVSHGDITLLCANGLHRKYRPAELAGVLGEDLVGAFSPLGLKCHDAEDTEELSLVGRTAEGHAVEVNRLVAEADLTVYVNVNWLTMNGGWKSYVVGLGSRRSIDLHHAPEVLASVHSKMEPGLSPMHRIVNAMGTTVATMLGHERFFSVETVLNNSLPYQPIAVNAGFPPAVHRETLAVLRSQQAVHLDGQADILVYSLPNVSPYAVGSCINPVLVHNVALGYMFSMYRNRPLVRAGGAIVIGQPCDYQFDDDHHPSYREFFDRVLAATREPAEMRATFEAEFLNNTAYMAVYQRAFGFHPLHPFYAWYWSGIAARYAGMIYLAGVREPWVAERLGLEPAPSIEEGIEAAQRQLGAKARVRYLPSAPLVLGEVR